MMPRAQKPTQRSRPSGMNETFLHRIWIGIVSNWTILFVYVSIHPEIGLITEDNLLLIISLMKSQVQTRHNTHFNQIIIVQCNILPK